MGSIKGWRLILIAIVFVILGIETVLLAQSIIASPLEAEVAGVDVANQHAEESNSAAVPASSAITWITQEPADPSLETESSGYIFAIEPAIYPFFNSERDVTYYWVDLGGFATIEDALARQRDLQERAIYATVHPLSDGDVHVMTGPYASSELAKASFETLLSVSMAP